MTRKFNFCAGPAALPAEVLEQAQAEMLDWQGRGLSVMEMSHRSAEIVGIAEEAEQDLRDLLAIPDDYAVLFMQGGGHAHFSAVPLNLAQPEDTADYIVTGSWSKKALAEGKGFVKAQVAASTEDTRFTTVPDAKSLRLSSGAAYVHYCPNETIHGVAFPYIPETDAPLVADYSSAILSEPLDVTRFGVIYAGAQKNIGPAGLSVVIVRKDLLERARQPVPSILNYTLMAENGSMYNTPPTYSWYLAGLVFKWLKRQGGLEGIAEVNRRKAAKLYGAIDQSDFYANPVDPACRSIMNVPFTLADSALEKVFLAESEEAGLLNLKGHRSVGGMRASIYNAVPEAAVDALIDFMADFEKRHG
ncbi:MAG: 3-phosphoserine/phosphohydroxythreonine transaminase [Gammaproteobacteria bacterium]|nr:MAG: 3-phosphoserine/phosphohydroxythreonine transaminase [Gammaproteobacteria bacterium]